MQNLIQDIRYAARMLHRNPGFTATAVLALALGIGANTAVFTVVNGVLLRPLPFPEPGRLFLISYTQQNAPFATPPSLSDRHYLEFRRHDQLFERIATFSSSAVSLTGAGDPVRVPTVSTTPDFFAVLRVNPALGRTFLPKEDQPGRDAVAMLGDKLWRNRFGADARIVGKTITLDGVAHTVIGVMPPGFTFPSDAELWRPMAVRIDSHNSMSRPVVGRLKAGISQQQAQAALEAFAAGLPPESDGRREMTPRIVPLKESLVGDSRKSLLIFAGAVAFVLLIACANVANLLLMRAASRQQEVAMRSALGAGRWRLIRQLLTESTLVSLCGGAAGMLLALWGVPGLLALAPGGKIPRVAEIQIDGWAFAFTFGISLLTGIVFGLAPAFRATRRELRESLSHGARSVIGRHERLRSVLVVSEIALALVLLSGAGLMLKSFLRMRAVDPGFRPENVLTVTVDLPPSVYSTATQMQAFHERALAKLAGLPGVIAAGAVNWRPLGPALVKGDFQLEGGRRRPRGYIVDKPGVSADYFHAMGIRLLSGRDFTRRDNAGAPRVSIISQSVARQLWPGEEPVGKRISMADHPKPGDWLTIVGVVDDIRQQSLTRKPSPAIYQPYLQINRPFFLDHMTFAIRMVRNSQSGAPALRAVFREMDKDQPVQMASMEELVAATTAEPLFQTRLLSAFSILALMLSAIGIYGVLAYSVTERTHEIGIRMALGCGTGELLWMVLRRTLTLAGAGVALGMAGALAVTRVLAKFLFEVKPTDHVTFIAVAVLLAAVALVAGWIPARRASRVDPLVALRYE
jgi:putative ABC transport system permease protein